MLTKSWGDVPELAATVTFTLVLVAGVMERLAGDSWIANGAAAVTDNEKVAECMIAPLLPVTTSGALVPKAALCDAAN